MPITKEVIVLYTDDGMGNSIGEIVGEVVRCKDCIDATYGEYGLECNYHGRDVGENDYCVWGERKEDAKTN